MTSLQPPSRDDVSTRWQAVVGGELPREVVSEWAEPLMFAKFDVRPDALVMEALQCLHGFDMTYRSNDHRLVGHGPPGEYVRTLGQITEEFNAWVERCAAFDPDPEAWLAERRREAERYVREERSRR